MGRIAGLAGCFLMAVGAVVEAAFFEFEGTAIPDAVSGKNSEVSLDTRHRYRGEQALRWDWEPGASLRLDTPIECNPALNRIEGGHRRTRSFKFWIYSEVPRSGKQVKIFFGDETGEPCSFSINLDFTGWRSAWVSYERDMEGAPDRDLSYIRFEAPADAGPGTFWIDDIAPSLSVYIGHHTPDRQVPFVNTDMQGLSVTLPHNTSILIDQTVDPIIPEDELSRSATAAFREIEARVIQQYPPKKTDVASLISAFETYHITKSDEGVVRGDFLPHLASNSHASGFPKRMQPAIKALVKKHDFWAYADLMLEIAQAYSYQNDQPAGTEQANMLRAAFLLMAEHLLDQGWQAGSGQGSTHLFGYSSRSWPPAIFLMRKELAEAGRLDPMVDSLLWFYNVKKHFISPPSHFCDMDYLKTTSLSDLLSILVLPDSPKKELYFNAFKNNFGEILSMTSPGTQDGIKSDGGLFHHEMHYEGYGVPGIMGATRVVDLLDGTAYELPPAAYVKLKQGYLAASLWGYPFGGFNACGRHPLLTESEDMAASMLVLAKAAPETDSFDSELAAVYLAMEGGDSAALFGRLVDPKIPQGMWSMNYHSGGVYRHGNSTVLLKGFGCGVISHETFLGDNRYGSYGSHGTIQVFENTRAHASGFDRPGWGWSQPPGATTLILPLDILEGDPGFHGRVVSQRTPFAGCADLDHEVGLFAFQLDPGSEHPHDEALTVRKSVLCIEGKLVCLGSGLSNQSDYPLATTLFQCGLREGHSTVQLGGTPEPIGMPFSKIWNSGRAGEAPGWIIDPYGTGHWIAQGSLLKLEVGHQESRHNKTKEPTEGDFALAWIDHGKGAEDAAYEYVSVLEADAATMDALSATPFHIVKRRDERTHAILVPSEKLWSLVSFEPLEKPVGPFLSISQPSLVLMKQLSGSTVRMSVTDPRLELDKTTTAPPVEVALKIKGRFKLVGKFIPGVSAKVEGDKTLLLVRCAEGLPTVFSLKSL